MVRNIMRIIVDFYDTFNLSLLKKYSLLWDRLEVQYFTVLPFPGDIHHRVYEKQVPESLRFKDNFD